MCHRCTEIVGDRKIDYTKPWMAGSELRQVDFSRETIGDFAYHIANNPGIFLQKSSMASEIKNQILAYAKEIRNSRTHKHALLDWHRVEAKERICELLRLLVRECK